MLLLLSGCGIGGAAGGSADAQGTESGQSSVAASDPGSDAASGQNGEAAGTNEAADANETATGLAQEMKEHGLPAEGIREMSTEDYAGAPQGADTSALFSGASKAQVRLFTFSDEAAQQEAENYYRENNWNVYSEASQGKLIVGEMTMARDWFDKYVKVAVR